MVCEKVTTAAAKNVQFSQENQQQEGRSRFLQVLLLAMAAVNDAIAVAVPLLGLDGLLATVAAAAVAWHIFRGKRPPQENLQTQVSEVQDAVRGCCTSWFPSIITQCRGLLGCTDDSTQKSLVRTKPEAWLRWLDDAYSRRYSKQTRKGRKSIHPPRTTGAGPLVLLCAMAGVVLRLDAVGAVPLTKALYAEIASGAKESKIVTSIPAREFQNFEGDVTLGEMPLLQSIGDQAFHAFKGILKFEVGDSCSKLAMIGGSAFNNINNVDSVITIEELPAMTSIGRSAFQSFKGVLKFEVGNCPKLKTIGGSAFYGVTNPATVITLGATPILESIGLWAFTYMNGVVRIRLGDCAKLTSIGQRAFESWNSAESVIAIGATPQLQYIGETALGYNSGLMTLQFGNCDKLTTIGTRAFIKSGNAESVIVFGATPILKSVGVQAFLHMKGSLEFQVDDCIKLTTIGDESFFGLTAESIVSIGATPSLQFVGARAFTSIADISMNAGKCPSLALIGEGAFDSITNPKAYIVFEDLKGLKSIGEKAFADFKGVFRLGGFSSNLKSVDAAAFQGTVNKDSIIYLTSKDSVPALELVLAQSDFGGTIKYGEIVGCGSSDSDMPLTKDAYEAMQLLSIDDKASREKEITCIPANEFISYGNDVV